ncbi:PilZ domain-containing protein [Effusibacillus pohliae]|uniref:PilZ domain-containing protein n=1 Tax=Effusibacillus pohliae TaxID=232270 RepID=UPI0003763027|nr:PilZ domain-containing protein [Effusibacillus pohliae]
MKQREFFRVPLTAFCSLRLRKLGSKLLPIGEEFEVEVQNISGGGLCFLSDRDLPVSEMLIWQFAIDVPEQKINVYGQLVWKKPEDSLLLYGAEFIFFEEKEQKNLIMQINQLQIRRRKKEKYMTE